MVLSAASTQETGNHECEIPGGHRNTCNSGADDDQAMKLGVSILHLLHVHYYASLHLVATGPPQKLLLHLK